MEIKEGKIKAVAKKPMLNREAAKDYEFAESVWRLNDFHTQHGGSPTIVGLVTIMDASIRAKTIPRYKLEFPDGFIDYAKVDNFNEFYDMEFEREVNEYKDNHLFNMNWKSTVSITKWDLSDWGLHQTGNCMFFHLGKIQVKIWKPKLLRKKNY